MKPLGPCPRCGESHGYWHRQPVRGVWECTINADGSTDSTELGGIIYRAEPKTVTCCACGKRVPNPNIDGGEE